MQRVAIKITGAQGQGINSVGEMCAKGLKRAGYCVFGYREYNSLIKGGHSSYQLDVSDDYIESTQTLIDILVCFNHHGLEKNIDDVKDGGIVLHQTPDWEFPAEKKEILDERKITIIELPTLSILEEVGAPLVAGNMVMTAAVWALIGREETNLQLLSREEFSRKGGKVVQMNQHCIEKGTACVEHGVIALPKPQTSWSDHLLLTGSEAMGLGVIHAGCRLFVGYPMTPASPLLSFISANQNETQMIIKQAEDEITAAQMMSGAMHMGTRSATATSGGGFDLMTETVSLNGIIENPSVFILAQRPGPATGLPTWTAQGDLLLATFSAHGEFPKLVMSVSGADDAFYLLADAFNAAEEFQIPVIVLTDKQIAEGIYTQKSYDVKKVTVKRGLPDDVSGLTPSDRYHPGAKSGISPRWLPGTEAATYCAQGDEHDSEGNVDESAGNAVEQMEKRMRKMEALREALPEPEISGDTDSADLLIVSWGSNKGVIEDVRRDPVLLGKKIAYVHYTYLWPLKVDTLKEVLPKAKKTVLIECNHEGQLGKLLQMEGGVSFDHRLLKYDGRPFFYDELLGKIADLVEAGDRVPIRLS